MLNPLFVAHKIHHAWRLNRSFREVTKSSENMSKYLAGTAAEWASRKSLVEMPINLCAGVFLICRCTLDCIEQLEKVEECRNKPFTLSNFRDLLLAVFELSNRMILLHAAFAMNDETKRNAVRHLFINMQVTNQSILQKKECIFNCLDTKSHKIDKLFIWIRVPLSSEQVRRVFENVVWSLEKLQTLDNKVTRTTAFFFKEMLREGAAVVSHTLFDYTPDFLLSDYEKEKIKKFPV